MLLFYTFAYNPSMLGLADLAYRSHFQGTIPKLQFWLAEFTMYLLVSNHTSFKSHRQALSEC